MTPGNDPRATVRRPASIARARAGFTVMRLMMSVIIISLLALMTVPSYTAVRMKFYNATALSDVVSAGKALEAMDGSASFSQMITGPASLSGLPGPRVSPGTIMFVQRQHSSNGAIYYVRGVHRDGATTYYFLGGRLYTSEGQI